MPCAPLRPIDAHCEFPAVARGLARSPGGASRSVVVPREHRPMRRGNPAEGPTIQLGDVDYLTAAPPLAPTDDRPVERARTSRGLLDQRTLIDELWRVSHFGWIPEGVIRRALTLARGRGYSPTHGSLVSITACANCWPTAGLSTVTPTPTSGIITGG